MCKRCQEVSPRKKFIRVVHAHPLQTSVKLSSLFIDDKPQNANTRILGQTSSRINLKKKKKKKAQHAFEEMAGLFVLKH